MAPQQATPPPSGGDPPGAEARAAGPGSCYLGMGAVLENLNVTGLVGGHWDYRDKLPLLVHLVGLGKGQSLPLPPSVFTPAVPSLPVSLAALPLQRRIADVQPHT